MRDDSSRAVHCLERLRITPAMVEDSCSACAGRGATKLQAV